MEAQKISASIETHFGNITDPRIERNKLHLLIDILTIAICASVCGADKWEDVEDFGKVKEEPFLHFPMAFLPMTPSTVFLIVWIRKNFKRPF